MVRVPTHLHDTWWFVVKSTLLLDLQATEASKCRLERTDTTRRKLLEASLLSKLINDMFEYTRFSTTLYEIVTSLSVRLKLYNYSSQSTRPLLCFEMAFPPVTVPRTDR